LQDLEDIQTYTCGGCGKKKLHYSCFKKHVLEKYDLPPFSGDHAVACTKKCHQKLSSGGSNDPRKLPWSKDGKNGPDDPNNSEAILLTWLMTPGNYSRYRGGRGNAGTRKTQFAEDIARKINQQGVRRERTGKQVLDKITHIEDSFRSAHDFAHTETGAGLQKEDEGSFRDAVLKKCPWYYDLLEIFQDRASARPILTNIDMDNGSWDVEEEGSSDNEDNEEADDDEMAGTGTERTTGHGTRSETSSVRDDHRGGEIADDEDDEDDETDTDKRNKELSSDGKSSDGKRSLVEVAQRIKRTKKKKKGWGKQGTDDSMEGFSSADWIARFENKLAEMTRHNKAMEQLALRQAESSVWDTKTKELEYKVLLHSRYRDFKDKGMSDDSIRAIFPDMEIFMGTAEDD
jgi:hypothetical protein